MRKLVAPKYTQLADRHQQPTHREWRTFKYKTEAISESVTLFLALMKV